MRHAGMMRGRVAQLSARQRSGRERRRGAGSGAAASGLVVLPVPRTRWHALADLTGDLDIRRLLALLRDDEPPIDVLEQVLRRIDETLS